MIKINLTPELELESPYWWVPTAVVVFIFAAIGFGYGQYDLSQMKLAQVQHDESLASINAQMKKYADAKLFEKLDGQFKEKQQKLKLLKEVTGNQVDRFRPVLVLDLIQVLKPRGVWIRRVEMANNSQDIKIEGASFDNLLLSEFLANLKVTAAKEINPDDIRTKIYFDGLDLKYSRKYEGGEGYPDIGSHYRFIIEIKIKNHADVPNKPQKAPGAEPAPPEPKDAKSVKELDSISTKLGDDDPEVIVF